MTLTIFNGSPRKHKSNSKILTDKFAAGYKSRINQEIVCAYLAETDKEDENINLFQRSSEVLIIFPLYVDSMPGMVKRFFEKIVLQPHTGKKRIGFIVQSGFPESIHSSYIEKYVQGFIKRLNYEYLGSVIKGGVEGIQVMPAFMTKALYADFYDLGIYFADNRRFNTRIMNKLAKPYKLSWIKRVGTRFYMTTGLINFYWNTKLKENNALHKRFDQPYLCKNLRNFSIPSSMHD